MTNKKILVSILGHGASWNGAPEDTPWEVFVTEGGTCVLQGGRYPDEVEHAFRVLDHATMTVAESVGKSVQRTLLHLGFECEIEILGDA